MGVMVRFILFFEQEAAEVAEKISFIDKCFPVSLFFILCSLCDLLFKKYSRQLA